MSQSESELYGNEDNDSDDYYDEMDEEDESIIDPSESE